MFYQMRASADILNKMASVPTNSGPNIKHVLGACSPTEIKLAKAACKFVFTPSIDKSSFTYGVCCNELKVCARYTKQEKRGLKLVSKMKNVQKCSDIQTRAFEPKTEVIDALVSYFEIEIPFDVRGDAETFYSTCPEKHKEVFEEACDKFYAKSQKQSGNKESVGYGFCCKNIGICSGPFYTQVWFFAVCGGVGLLLIGGIVAVVVYFFYLRKKRGGGKIHGGGIKSSKKSTKKSKSKK